MDGLDKTFLLIFSAVPIMNMLILIFLLISHLYVFILKPLNFDNVLKYVNKFFCFIIGDNWDESKNRIKEKRKKKLQEKMRAIDPLGEEDWSS